MQRKKFEDEQKEEIFKKNLNKEPKKVRISKK
jgi:hypothetical protein